MPREEEVTSLLSVFRILFQTVGEVVVLLVQVVREIIASRNCGNNTRKVVSPNQYGWAKEIAEEANKLLIEDEHLIEEIEEVERFLAGGKRFWAEEKKKKFGRLYPIIVDYGQTLSQMIKAGNYVWTNSDIKSENFPIVETSKAEVETVLVHLNKKVSTEHVLKHLDSLGLRPATIAELLAFGAKYPDVQRQFSVVALGSVWVLPNGNRHVPYLCEGGHERGLGLGWYDCIGWSGLCRFLAVSK